ncbi:MAG: transposase [Olsenella profusa]
MLDKAPRARREALAASLEAIRAQESGAKCLAKDREVASELGAPKPEAAAGAVESGAEGTPAYALLPPERWRRIRANNGIERLNREIEGCTDAVGSFPAGTAAVMLAAARCEYVAEGSWGSRRYLDADLLRGWDEREVLKGWQDD